jgi:hypothetical protein
MRLFGVGIEDDFDMPIERPHHADAQTSLGGCVWQQLSARQQRLAIRRRHVRWRAI